jgi:hypothetical protein
MSQRRTSATGLFFALLALVMQLASGATVPRMEALAALAGAATICHAHETSDEAPRSPHAPADCLFCPLCVSLSAPALANSASPLLPAPPMVVVARAAVLPPSTAPPTVVVLAAQPRGPPHILT